MTPTHPSLPWWRRPQTWILLGGFGLLALVGGILNNYYAICRFSAPYHTDNLSKLPITRVGLVLGTGKLLLPNKQPNLYFRYRMEAAVRLFRAGKVRYLLVSGNNVTQGATETVDMRNDLIRRGIPAQRILTDPKGVRTLDSVLRCHTVYKQKRFIVVSQPFHNERAIYLGRHHGLTVFGYNAQDVRTDTVTLLHEQIREHLARVKAWLDLFVLHTPPRFPENTPTSAPTQHRK